MGAALVAEGLVKRYRGRAVVDGVSFSVNGGEIVGLLGPNGAGKTTSFGIVVGLVPPDAGTVRLDGVDLSALPMHLRARAGVGYLPQEPSIFRRLSVRENLLAALEQVRGLSRAQRHARAEQLLAEFGLTQVASTTGDRLSGGERRRAEIARSLVIEPSVMLFDEPFAGVDPINIAELQKEIRTLKERGLGVLITDHNVRDTLTVCDRASIIVAGKILEEGTPAQLASSRLARSVYLGESFALPAAKV